jgi:hypothetical protein
MVLNTVEDEQLAEKQNYFKFEQGVVLDYTVVLYSGRLAKQKKDEKEGRSLSVHPGRERIHSSLQNFHSSLLCLRALLLGAHSPWQQLVGPTDPCQVSRRSPSKNRRPIRKI